MTVGQITGAIEEVQMIVVNVGSISGTLMRSCLHVALQYLLPPAEEGLQFQKVDRNTDNEQSKCLLDQLLGAVQRYATASASTDPGKFVPAQSTSDSSLPR